MHLLWTLLIGLIVGCIAAVLMPGKRSAALFITLALGIAGSLVATWIIDAIGFRPDTLAGFISSVLGAMLLSFLYRVATNRRTA